MPNLAKLAAQGSSAEVQHSFPAVTWPSQAALLTGKSPRDHGVVANGFFWRDDHRVEMWTAWNEVIQEPQIWDRLKQHGLKSAAWFPMLSKGCGADFVCMPAPIHQPDGSEDLWCYTKPQDFYGTLLEKYGHFPLKHFWGPLANILSSKWIAETAVDCATEFQPDFFYIYLPHLDYAAQKFGPNSEQAMQAVADLDDLLGKLFADMNDALNNPTWLVHSEYVIQEVDHISYPNRVLRKAGLLEVREDETDPGKEQLDFANSKAWALVDHQFSHVFVRDRDPAVIEQIVSLFRDESGIDKVLTGNDRAELDHERSGDVVLVSNSNSWQAYYWWDEDQAAPSFAHNVDIHRKPGYDPVELCFDMTTMSVPLDATLIKGSHGVPQTGDQCDGVIVCSQANALPKTMLESDVFQFAISHYDGDDEV